MLFCSFCGSIVCNESVNQGILPVLSFNRGASSNITKEPAWIIPRRLIGFLRLPWGTFGPWRSQHDHDLPILRSAKPRPSLHSSVSASLRFWRPDLGLEANSAAVALSPNAYSNGLKGLIIPTPENLKFDTLQVSMLRDLDSCCKKRTDFHFPSLQKQFQEAQTQALLKEEHFQPGAYFCTRHSNLCGRLQVVFHLLIPSDAHQLDELPESIAHRALSRIFADCHRCQVLLSRVRVKGFTYTTSNYQHPQGRVHFGLFFLLHKIQAKDPLFGGCW